MSAAVFYVRKLCFSRRCTGCRAKNMLQICYADSFFFFHFIKWHDIISCKEKGKEKLTAAGQALIYALF